MMSTLKFQRCRRPALLAALLSAIALIHSAVAGERPALPMWAARGLVEARVEATLSSQIAARIARLPVDRGVRVAKGDLLVAFDCAIELARLKAARAELDGHQARLTSLRRLDQMGSIGRADVHLAAAEQAKAAAVVEERQVIVDGCTVTAPFDGLVIDVPVRVHEGIEPGRALMQMLDDRTLRLSILAPSAWSAWLAPGMPLTFTVDETGEALPARVSHLGARIDTSSQTVPVFATIERRTTQAPLIAGMSGTASFRGPAEAGASHAPEPPRTELRRSETRG